MYVQRIVVPVTTAADGTATVFTPNLSGKISQIRYVKNNFTDGSTFNLTLEATGETVWNETGVNASATRAPRQATHGTTGTASLYAAGGTAVQDKIALANDRISIAITNGGNAASGTFHILVE